MVQAGKRLLAGNLCQALNRAQSILQGCNPSRSNRGCKHSQKSPCRVCLCYAVVSGYSRWFGQEKRTRFSGCSCSRGGGEVNPASLILFVSGGFWMVSVLGKGLEGIETSLPGRMKGRSLLLSPAGWKHPRNGVWCRSVRTGAQFSPLPRPDLRAHPPEHLGPDPQIYTQHLHPRDMEGSLTPGDLSWAYLVFQSPWSHAAKVSSFSTKPRSSRLDEAHTSRGQEQLYAARCTECSQLLWSCLGRTSRKCTISNSRVSPSVPIHYTSMCICH